MRNSVVPTSSGDIALVRARVLVMSSLIAGISGAAAAAEAPDPSAVSTPAGHADMPNNPQELDPSDDAQRLYEEAKRNLLPLTPGQIQDYRSSRDEAQAATFGGPPPLLSSREIQLDVSPGVSAPTVLLSPPFVTSIVFVDATGAAWPLSSVDGASAAEGTFAVNWDTQQKIPPHNLLTVRPLQNHISGNVVVTLQGFDLPISLVLDADSRNEHGLRPHQIDGMLTVKLMRPGPQAKLPVLGPTGADPTMYQLLHQFLLGVPPTKAREVSLEPALGRAWIYEGELYFRTDRALRWPAWTAQASAPGGTSVYEMPLVPLLMLSVEGESLQIKVGMDDAISGSEVMHDRGG